MNLLATLNSLKDASTQMAIEKGEEMTGAPGHGEPGDYGFKGKARNGRVRPRMAGGSFVTAVADTLINAGLDSAQPYIDSGMQSLASTIKGTGKIASR
tara:strand:+ start:170 stop:463 length:294 start_codon:yes stop_codon:yes gene_type:complete